MPCYDYVCPKCKSRFESICNREVKDTQRCEKCNVVAERVITTAPATRIIGYCFNNDNRKPEYETLK